MNVFRINGKTETVTGSDIDEFMESLEKLNIFELSDAMAKWSQDTIDQTELMMLEELKPRMFIAECIRRMVNSMNALQGAQGASRTVGLQTKEVGKYD